MLPAKTHDAYKIPGMRCHLFWFDKHNLVTGFKFKLVRINYSAVSPVTKINFLNFFQTLW